MIWLVLTAVSPIFAVACWYAKGKGIIAVVISSIILMFITSQTFVLGFGDFDIAYIPELFNLDSYNFCTVSIAKTNHQSSSIRMVLFITTSPFFKWGFKFDRNMRYLLHKHRKQLKYSV